MKNATPEQLRIIESDSGVKLVEACPGSGKTSTLVKRCSFLPVAETKIVLAFNKKAADEFKNRLGRVSCCDVKTFHSYCFREVRRNPKAFGYSGNPQLAEETFFKQLNRANQKKFYSWEESGWDEDYIKSAEHSLYTEELRKLLTTNLMPGKKVLYNPSLVSNKC